MKRGIYAPLGLALAAIAAAVAVGIAGAGAATTAGTWELIPAQSDTTGNPVETYKTAVRPPINADGSSVFSAKRGVIPVQFDVLAGTATPHTIGPVVFESFNGGSDPTDASSTSPFAWSGLIFTPSTAMTFNDVQSLVSTYSFTTGDCHGGSLRWTINVDDGTTTGQNVHVYYGDPGGVQSCTGSASGSGENLMTTGATNRFEIQGGWPNATGPVSTASGLYRTYDDASSVVGTDSVNWIGLIVDSGWGGDQVINPDTLAASVNGDSWVRETEGTTYTYSDLAPTCDIPQAKIVITKTSTSEGLEPNEDYSVQPKDTGVYFRNVDCKLIYNLDVSTLKGAGAYKVQADFGEGPGLDPALFGLK